MDLVLLLILGTLWGSSYLFIKVAVAEVPVLTLVAGRLTLATALLWVILRARGLSMSRKREMWAIYGLLGLLNAALPYSLVSWGEQYISSGLASLLTATMPIFTVLLTHFLLEEAPISRVKVAGVLVGFVGVGILMLPDLRRGLQADLLGQLAVAGAALCYAGAAIVAHGRLQGQPPLTSAAGQLTGGMLWMAPLSLLIDRPFDLSPSLPALASWLALTLVGTILAYVLYFTLIERTSATFVSMVTYIIPISGLLLGTLVLGEPLSLTVLGSLALILLGVVLVRS